MNQKIIAIGTLLCAVLLGVGPWTVFKACEPTPEKVMKCHWACVAVIPIALLLGVTALMELVAKDSSCKKALSAVGVTAIIGVILLPSVLIGGCMKPEMPCNVLAFPCIYAISAIGLVLQAMGFLGKDREGADRGRKQWKL